MGVEDLSISELMEIDSEGGMVRFAGQRALTINATAQANPAQETHHFGLSTACAVLRLGFVQGWRMAKTMQDLSEWEREDDWLHESRKDRIHRLLPKAVLASQQWTFAL